MADPWRFRPPTGGGSSVVCPVCAAAHFPFCPPPHPSSPYMFNAPPQPPHHHPTFHSPPFSHTPHRPPPPLPYSNSWDPSPRFGHEDRVHKRMRLEELDVPKFSPPLQRFGNYSLDDDRRLNLIRDHGRPDAAPLPYARSNGVYRADRFASSYDGYVMLPDRQHGRSTHISCPTTTTSLDYEKENSGPLFPVLKQLDKRVESSLQRQHDKDNFVTVPTVDIRYNEVATLRVQGHSSQMYPALPPQPALHPPDSASPAFVSSMSGRSVNSFHENRQMVQGNAFNESPMHKRAEFTGALPLNHAKPLKRYPEVGQQLFSTKNISQDKPTVVDAWNLFKQPQRASRPDHIVVILRGLPGSGKSYLAKALRDLEVEHGGTAPRVHAIDDYFMIEVEKNVEDTEGSKTSGSSKSKRPITKKVIEYCYEAEMEEVYRASMLKAFKKTLDEGNFTFVIVDDRNLRVADFAQFWATAKRAGYEVYLLEATYKDPAGCAARNVHGFTLEDIKKMADQWEEAPSLYLKLDIQSLFHGDDLGDNSIQEVEMDMDDSANGEENVFASHDNYVDKREESNSVSLDSAHNDGAEKVGERWATDEEEVAGVKELRLSKWSKDLDEDIEISNDAKANVNSLSGLIQTYGKRRKSVHWGDQANKGGFSINAAKKQSVASLVIGPGSGYNSKLNPLHDDEKEDTETSKGVAGESKKRFHDQLRAERESFRAVFDKRRHRVGGLNDASDV